MSDRADLTRELLSIASHQIRAPLAAVKGLLSLVKDGTYGPVDPRAQGALTKALFSVDELIELTDLLLDLRQLEAGKMEYRFAKTDLVTLVRDAAAPLASVAESRDLAFSLDLPDHPLWVNADAHKLKQVVRNIADNAIKYTPHGFVKIAVAEEAAAAALIVADSGIGISAAALPYIFDEFIRDDRVKKEFYGAGLGLFIAKKFVEAHGGTIRAASAGEGKGSTFFVNVPLAG